MFDISTEDIVIMHDRIVTEIGGRLGIREPGLLTAIVEKPNASFGGADLYPSLFDKAAALFEAICNYHVFVDGNKRTAIATLEYFLHKQGLVLSANQREKEKFTLATASTNPDLADVAAWIEKHCNEVKK